MANDDTPDRRAAHPVKDVVLPLAVVLALVGNALLVGIQWGRLGQRLDALDASQKQQTQVIERLQESTMTLRDRVRDLERDAEQDRKDFLLLEDYTRGRIDRLPYRAPPARRSP